jgi:hypothetical protein
MLDNPKLLRLLGVVVVIAAVVMTGATFTPFITQGCISCPLDYTFPSRSLFQGLDGWIVLWVVVALAVFATSYLMSVRHRTSAVVASLVLSAAAMALGIFERADAANRVLGQDNVPPPVELGHPGVHLQGFPPPTYTDFGFYVFLGVSVVAVLAAAAIVLMTQWASTKPGLPANAHPASSHQGWKDPSLTTN